MIYADYNATAPLLDSVKTYLKNRFEKENIYANPSSLHSLGRKVNFAMTKCRNVCAQSVGAHAHQVFFNSGASEGISHIFFSVLDQTEKKTIITSEQEHAAVYQVCNYYQDKGYKILKVDTKDCGNIDLDHLKTLLSDDVALVSIIAANNETGAVQPFHEIGELCQAHGAVFFPDTTQIIGKAAFNFNETAADYMVVSGHKLGALPGTGFVVAKDPSQLTPMVFGGLQECGKRSGTQNYIGIETLAVACKEATEKLAHAPKLAEARDLFEKSLQSKYPDLVVFCQESQRLSGTSLLGYKGIHGQAVQLELESYNIFVTTSSACSDNEPETSKVLKAMGIKDDEGRSAIRISFKNDQNPEVYSVLEEKLGTVFDKLSKIKY